MDVTTAVRSDVLPAVGSFVIPGAVAATPYVWLFWGTPHNLKAFVDSNQAISAVAGALLVVGIGLLVESLGQFVESHGVDKLHGDPKLQEQWYEYLKIAWEKEPIGQRYLRRVLTTFKFELNMVVAVVATTPGIIALGYYNVVPGHAVRYILLGCLGFALYFAYAAFEDSKVLHRLRGHLITVAEEQSAARPLTRGERALEAVHAPEATPDTSADPGDPHRGSGAPTHTNIQHDPPALPPV